MKTSLRSILKTSVPIVVDLAAQIVMWTLEINLVSHIAPHVMSRFYPEVGATGVDALTAVGNVVQIIILTCHPERYRALAGVHFFDMESLLKNLG